MAGKCGDLAGKKVACTVSGWNIDIDEFGEALREGPMAHV